MKSINVHLVLVVLWSLFLVIGSGFPFLTGGEIARGDLNLETPGNLITFWTRMGLYIILGSAGLARMIVHFSNWRVQQEINQTRQALEASIR